MADLRTPVMTWLMVATMVWLESPISGTSLNPARSIGPALVTWFWQDQWLYCIAPPLGSMLAVGAFRSALSQATLPPAQAVKPVEVVRSNEYSEGVVIDHTGNIYFSHGKSITVVAPDGTNRIWAETGAPNGHKVLADGTHLVANSSKQEVLHLDADGKILGAIAKEFNGKPLRAPNDLTLDEGGFYFTDPGGSSIENPIGTVYYVDPERKIQQVVTGLAFPNGIVGKSRYLPSFLSNRESRLTISLTVCAWMS